MNDTDEQLQIARQFTPLLRGSDDEYWPRLRVFLREKGIDPTRAAVGDLYSEQAGPYAIIVASDGRVLGLQVTYNPADEPEFQFKEPEWLETTDSRREEWTAIFAALTILGEESPGSFDPVDVLTELVERKSNEMRQDIGSDWSGFRSFLTGEGVDPARTLLLQWYEVPSVDLSTERIGTVFFEGRWFAFTMLVSPPLGRAVKVTSWKEVNEAQARTDHGSEVDAALRLAETEGRPAAGA